MARTVLKTNRYMVYAKPVKCRVEESRWLSPTTLQIGFGVPEIFHFRAGQFISVVIPAVPVFPGAPAVPIAWLGRWAFGRWASGSFGGGPKSIKRCYSLSSSPEAAQENRYELCIKLVPGGRGSQYMANLKVGDVFDAFAPYGQFVFKSAPKRNIVFISTSSGVAPFRSMVQSPSFYENCPKRVVFISGCRTESEILYPRELEATGIEVVRAVSQATPAFDGFHGRVTDYLKSLGSDWCWHDTDFYICGNPEMVAEVETILKVARGVSAQNIHRELFSAPRKSTNVVSILRQNSDNSKTVKGVPRPVADKSVAVKFGRP